MGRPKMSHGQFHLPHATVAMQSQRFWIAWEEICDRGISILNRDGQEICSIKRTYRKIGRAPGQQSREYVYQDLNTPQRRMLVPSGQR